ncbi:APC family permease [Saccharopolyspora rectivirgula]|uniref:Amino acid permease n=1 Tax=Saccharopolyspora rectivirgula TaxID=28042 RepID=A0A073AY22_9PSEU|nr:APC family permease [Saccharopolyspora rectivirgula]KEI44221.1 amino acid permease [Saccharopolyspora rectivirgula]
MAQQVETSRRLSSGTGAVPLALGGTLGAGLLLGPAPAAAAAGPWFPLGLLLALATAVCCSVSSAHASVAYRGPGAGYACARSQLGLVPSRIAGGTCLAGHVFALAAAGRVVGDLFAPSAASWTAAAVVLLVVLLATAGLRFRGAVAWGWLALNLAVVAVVVLACFAIQPVDTPVFEPPETDTAVGITGAAGALVFAYFGFERLTAPATEADRYRWPAVKCGTWFALAVITVLLGTLTAALARQLGWSRLALSSAPVRDALTAASAADLLPLVGAGVAVGLLPALHAGLESFRSTALAMLRERELPAFLGRTSSAGTPYLLDLAAGLTAAVLALLLDPVTAMLTACCCLLVYYALTNAGVRVLLTKSRNWPMRAACLGMALSVVLLMSLPVHALLTTLAVVVVCPLLSGLWTRRWS